VTDPIQVLREWVTVTERAYGRVRLTRTVTAEQAEAALAQVEALVQAARDAEILWAHKDATTERNTELFAKATAFYLALAPFKENP
jgi:hypothetical protein